MNKNNIRKIKTVIVCGVNGCKSLAKYQIVDGLLSFAFVCKDHKDLKVVWGFNKK